MRALFLLLLVVTSVFSASPAPSPLSIQPSGNWDGNDGAWSSFGIEVGTPPQSISLYPSTSENSIWTVVSEGCNATYVGPVASNNCSSARGSVFQPKQSSSWSLLGFYSLTYATADPLGYKGNAEYGFDNVTLGFWPGAGPAVGPQIIEGYGVQFPYLGALGLHKEAINLTTLQNSYPSLLTNLYNTGVIPSLSWGYTAGAVYADPPMTMYGSLTLGGYDATRFISNNASFPSSADVSQNLLVGLKSITSNATTAELLPGGLIYAAIDSLVSTIWLPTTACEAFELAFNLTWDNTTGLYLLDDQTHTSLLAQNPTINFTFSAPRQDGGDIDVSIVLPYSAFDLEIGIPYVASQTRYFPLQRADHELQYVLGRTFLQEAYIIMDYTRGNFSISQAQFPSSGEASKIIAILPPREASSQLHTAVIAGIAAGGTGVILSIVIVAVFTIRLRRRRRQVQPAKETEEDNETTSAIGLQGYEMVESVSCSPMTVTDPEMDAIDSQRLEMLGSEPVPELEASEKAGELHAAGDTHFAAAELLSQTRIHARQDVAGENSEDTTALPRELYAPGGTHVAAAELSPQDRRIPRFAFGHGKSPAVGTCSEEEAEDAPPGYEVEPPVVEKDIHHFYAELPGAELCSPKEVGRKEKWNKGTQMHHNERKRFSWEED